MPQQWLAGNADNLRLELRPGFGGDSRTTALSYSVAVLGSLAVALPLLAQGMWPVLAYALLQALVLAAALRHSARRGRASETITIDADWVEIRRSGATPRHWRLQRFATEVKLIESPYRLHPRRLVIRCRQDEIELGWFLDEPERERLAVALRQRIGPPGV